MRQMRQVSQTPKVDQMVRNADRRTLNTLHQSIDHRNSSLSFIINRGLYNSIIAGARKG